VITNLKQIPTCSSVKPEQLLKLIAQKLRLGQSHQAYIMLMRVIYIKTRALHCV